MRFLEIENRAEEFRFFDKMSEGLDQMISLCAQKDSFYPFFSNLLRKLSPSTGANRPLKAPQTPWKERRRVQSTRPIYPIEKGGGSAEIIRIIP